MTLSASPISTIMVQSSIKSTMRTLKAHLILLCNARRTIYVSPFFVWVPLGCLSHVVWVGPNVCCAMCQL
jgi:hypothetical protein